MGFGAIIASGDDNAFLPEDLTSCLVEVRVEQRLDDPTKFAIRFQEDIRDGAPFVMGASQLQPEQVITIAVKVEDEIHCLVRGPITEIKCSVMQGGPGSWFEARGQDRRAEMDRQCFQFAWEGRASDAARQIVDSYGFRGEVEETSIRYGQETQTLNQRATDLDFIKQIARQNNLHFWVTYDCRINGLNPLRQTLTVDEIANVKSSPVRNGLGSVPLPQIPLVPSTDVSLRVNVEQDQCPNVTSFELDEDRERPTSFRGSAVNDHDLRTDSTSAEDVQPAIRGGTDRLTALTGIERRVCITTAGNSQELQNRAESALTEAGWFVNAQASTTLHMLKGVLAPHEVTEIAGLGPRHSGPYRVKQATHVINAAVHAMDLVLQSNSVQPGG